MTFEEWFDQRFPVNTPEGSAARTGQFKEYLEESYQAGYDEGYNDGSYDPRYQRKDLMPG